MSFVAFRSRYFPVGGMQEPGMLVSEDQNLGFLTDLGYTHIIHHVLFFLSPLCFGTVEKRIRIYWGGPPGGLQNFSNFIGSQLKENDQSQRAKHESACYLHPPHECVRPSVRKFCFSLWAMSTHCRSSHCGSALSALSATHFPTL